MKIDENESGIIAYGEAALGIAVGAGLAPKTAGRKMQLASAKVNRRSRARSRRFWRHCSFDLDLFAAVAVAFGNSM